MIRYTKADTAGDLEEILVLQQANVIQRLTKYEIESQGFVTVTHSYEQLQKLNGTEKHVIAKDGDRLIGYLLAMTQQASHDIPVLIPMFDAFSKVSYRDKVITDYNFLVVGQVCIAKEYRGKGILDECYHAYKKYYSNQYDFAITEIDATNSRSLNAHQRIGFKRVHSYKSSEQTEWVIVLWDWKNEIPSTFI